MAVDMPLDAIKVLVAACLILRANTEAPDSACQLPGCHCSEVAFISTLQSTSGPIRSTHSRVSLNCHWTSIPKSKLRPSNNFTIGIENAHIRCADFGDPGTLLDVIHEQTAQLQVLTIQDCVISRESVSLVESYASLTTMSLLNVTIASVDTGDDRTLLFNASLGEESSNVTSRFSICSLEYLNHISVTAVSEMSFDNCRNSGSSTLKRLTRVEFRNNGFAHIPEFLPMAIHSTELILRGNSISDVSNNVFYNLTELLTLDLSSNKLTSLPEGALSRQIMLQSLNLSHNQMTSLPAKLLLHTHNLTNLDLSSNRLKFLPGQLFSSLHLLTILNLSHNAIAFVVRSQFARLTNLQHLLFGYNKLMTIPYVTSCLKLQLLDFRHNVIKYTLPSHFKGLTNLKGVGLKHNKIERFVLQHLAITPNLKVIDFSQNMITQIVYTSEVTVHGGSVVNSSLSVLGFVTYLVLDSNLLTDISGIGGTFTGLQLLSLNDNRIKSLFAKDLPSCLEILGLAYNRISTIQNTIFTHFPNLTFVSLVYNYPHLTSMPAMVAMTYPKSHPNIFLSGNLFLCDCRMAYLKTYANKNYSRSFRYYAKSLPEFADLSDLMCITGTDSTVRRLVEVDEKEFLCADVGVVCRLACGCCARVFNSSCPCMHHCPTPCRCYQGGSPWGEYDYRLICDKLPVIGFPSPIPPITTYLYLDNTTISVVSVGDLPGLGKLKYLFLNNTGISDIAAGSFLDLGSLKELYLNNNKLSGIVPGTWHGLKNVLRLCLQKNLIRVLQSEAFLELPRLLHLDLSDNLLTRLTTSFFSSPPPSLSAVLVDGNPLSCSCSDMLHTTAFLAVFGNCIANLETLHCIAEGNTSRNGNDTVAERTYFKDFDIDICYKNDTVLNATRVESYLLVTDNRYMWTLSVFSILLVTLVVVAFVTFRKRHIVQAWMFVKFGVRLRSPNTELDETGRTYDAFVSYSSLDETLVVRELAPRLEGGNAKGSPRYKLCLHYRDFPVGDCIADTIIESIEASKRTILLLSDNFLESEWCRFEFQTAHHHVLKERSHRLIIVLLHDVKEVNLDPDLSVHMKAGRFLKYADPWFWEKLYFALPDVPVVAETKHGNTELEEL